MNLQQLWLLAYEQARRHSSMDGKGTHEVLPIAEELLATNGYRRIAFLQGGGIGCPTSMFIQVALIDKIIF